VVYVASRREKKVAELLNRDGFENFLPLIKTKRKWSDRTKVVEVPLFNSYVFVKSNEAIRDKILQTPGVVKFLRYNEGDAQVTDQIVEGLKKALDKGYTFINSDELKLELGAKVEVIAGPFKGISGRIANYNNSNYVLIDLEAIGKQMCVKIAKNYIQNA